ncbi:MAG: ABC transporter permease [Nitrospirae bacterium]|nr:ABC transporter permease [Nitrospirota bacterium]
MIDLKNINKTYRTGKIAFQALRDVSLSIEQGEFVAIMGPSGSGKSTLLHLLGMLDRPDSGSYTIYDKEISSCSEQELACLRNHLIGFVFQQFHLLARTSAIDNAYLPLTYSGKRQNKARASQRLKEVGLAHREDHKPNELSGGEQQRVAIARALVNDPLIVFADEPTGNLDTQSEKEIIAILEELNRQGKTIILVTHENEIAEHARRIIFMRDGKIVSDKRKDAAVNTGEGPTTSRHPEFNQGYKAMPPGREIPEQDRKDRERDEDGKGFSNERQHIEEVLNAVNSTGARLPDHMQQAIQAILSHKVRAFLSILGILIGVAAVIAMLALGAGARESLEQRLASLGSNLLSVRPGSPRLRGVALETGSVTRFTVRDADAIAKLPPVKMVTPNVTGRGQVVYSNKNWSTRLEGVGVNYAKMRASEPILGRFFTEEDVRSRGKVAVLGLTVARELFAENDPVGSEIKINRINFKVIGVLPEKGATGWRDQDDVIVIPISTAMYRVLGKDYVDGIDVEVRGPDVIDQAQDEIEGLLVRRHRLTGDIKESIDIRNLTEIQETLASTTKTMSWLLGSIAVISLLVGGIGIMNIMLVSVTERTREIGLRKAIGARSRDILTQFIIEAVVMSVSGGVIGIAIGIGIASGLSYAAGWTTKVSISSVALATIFSVAVGMVFGIWPAKKASQLKPIEALRYE